MKKLAAVVIVLAAVVAIAIYSYKQYKHFYPTPQEGPIMEETAPPGEPPPSEVTR